MSLLRCMSPKLALRVISLRCNDVSARPWPCRAAGVAWSAEGQPELRGGELLCGSTGKSEDCPINIHLRLHSFNCLSCQRAYAALARFDLTQPTSRRVSMRPALRASTCPPRIRNSAGMLRAPSCDATFGRLVRIELEQPDFAARARPPRARTSAPSRDTGRTTAPRRRRSTGDVVGAEVPLEPRSRRPRQDARRTRQRWQAPQRASRTGLSGGTRFVVHNAGRRYGERRSWLPLRPFP